MLCSFNLLWILRPWITIENVIQSSHDRVTVVGLPNSVLVRDWAP